MKSRTMLLVIAALMLASVGCDYFVDYTVINGTEAPVNSVYFSDPCADWMRSVESTAGINIPANSQHRFGGAAPGEPKCVLIRATGLTYLTPYADSTTYLVEGDGNAASKVTSYEESIEPGNDPSGEDSSTLRNIATGVFAVALLGGFLAAAVITLRYFFGRRTAPGAP
jgi:hypothetical protein